MRTLKKYFFPIILIAGIAYVIYAMIWPKMLIKKFIAQAEKTDPNHRNSHKENFAKYGDDFYYALAVWNYENNGPLKSYVPKMLYDYSKKIKQKLGM